MPLSKFIYIYIYIYIYICTQRHIQYIYIYISPRAAAGGIGLNVNADKTEFVYFKQDVDISTLSGKPLRLVDQSTYLGSNISSKAILS